MPENKRPNNKPNAIPQFITPKEAGEILRVDVQVIYKYVRCGLLTRHTLPMVPRTEARKGRKPRPPLVRILLTEVLALVQKAEVAR